MVTIRSAMESDIENLVSIHVQAFEGFFLTQLGEEFLTELYKGFIMERSGICLVAEEMGKVVGFSSGTLQPQFFFKKLLQKHWYKFILASRGGIFQNPFFVIKKLINAITYRGEQPPYIEKAALLSSFAVAPEFNGKGIGKMLIKSFCEKVKCADVPYVYLTTDRDNNEKVNNIYKNLGFTLDSSFLKHGNRWMNRYIKKP